MDLLTLAEFDSKFPDGTTITFNGTPNGTFCLQETAPCSGNFVTICPVLTGVASDETSSEPIEFYLGVTYNCDGTVKMSIVGSAVGRNFYVLDWNGDGSSNSTDDTRDTWTPGCTLTGPTQDNAALDAYANHAETPDTFVGYNGTATVVDVCTDTDYGASDVTETVAHVEDFVLPNTIDPAIDFSMAQVTPGVASWAWAGDGTYQAALEWDSPSSRYVLTIYKLVSGSYVVWRTYTKTCRLLTDYPMAGDFTREGSGYTAQVDVP